MSTTTTPSASRLFRPLAQPLEQPAPLASTWRDRAPVFLVIALAVVLGAVQYRQFLEAHRQLWYAGTHDRNSHYLFALRLAADARSGQIHQWLSDVNGARVWSPLQAVLASGALTVGGYDYRLAVWPSLAGWLLAIVCGFLVARRMVPAGGNLAGAVAVIFIACSPAHRAYSIDVMLESLGAGLTLAVWYAYLVMVQSEEPATAIRAARWLGLALTVLFLHKYNYWLLAFLSVLAAQAFTWRHELWRLGRSFLATVDWRPRTQLLTPLPALLNSVILVLLVLVAAIYVRGDRPLVWNGREIGVFPPYNIIQIAYWIWFGRLIVWWKRTGRAWVDTLDPRARQFVRWHLCPVICWLALPKHFGPFVWYLSLGNSGAGQNEPALKGLVDYASWAVADYHVTVTCALLTLGLTLIAIVAVRRLNRGAAAVVAFLLLAAFLSVMHPNRKARNLHSWLPAAWVCAGAGAALLVHGRLTQRLPPFRPILAAGVLLGVGAAQLTDGAPTAHAMEGGPHPEMPCLLDVTSAYLPDLDGPGPTAIFSAVSIGPVAQWTFFERHKNADRLEDHRFAFGPLGEPNRAAFRIWLDTTPASTFVYIESLPGPAVQTPWEPISEMPLHAELGEVIVQQTVFERVRRQEFPHHGCAVTIWKRKS